MTTTELIELLKRYPPNLPVVFEDGSDMWEVGDALPLDALFFSQKDKLRAEAQHRPLIDTDLTSETCVVLEF